MLIRAGDETFAARAAMPQAAPREDRDGALAPEVVAALSPAACAALLWHSEETVPHECDGLTAYREAARGGAAETEEQVAAVLRTCHRLGVPVVARGAGTGLSGGAPPHHGRHL